MGSPAHISVPPPASSISSPDGSVYSPSQTETSISSSSPSLPGSSSSSSFTHHGSSFASASSDSQNRQEIKNHQRKQDLLEGHMVSDTRAHDATGPRHLQKCTCRKPSRGSKRALMGSCKQCNMGVSMRKACCRCAGAFAADCAALCCCPCAIISLLAFIVVELPSALATRMISHWKKRLSVKDSADSCSSNRDDSHSIATPTRAHKGAEVQAVHMIRFDTENLLKHFDAEHVGFGCLSQKRE
ncbi:hypothetical protein GOP47_0014144 [Adiantum capillus-veneris]|uniref:Uncharacterized protein n=1 Tax=Adiantum capillus-veneris TaxID=13818 RepID=A0A9D4UPV9_ADICA|nr:hypothetical protein GOP47_0014144 [Adiantum capillus-veneris]